MKFYFNGKLNLLKLNNKFINRSTFVDYCKNEILDQFLTIFKPIQNSLSFMSSGKKVLNYDKEFLQWFVGFTDAEGSFWINIKNNSEVHFVFQITLHIEDSAVLFYIREKLGVGIVTTQGKTCSYRLHAFQTIIETLIPIFDRYSLLTHKQLNYKDWREGVFLKKVAKEKGYKIDNITLDSILKLKSRKNSLRISYDGYILTSDMINKYWLLGFVEGEGSFYFTNSKAVFSITQKDKQVLEAIATFLQNINISPIYSDLFVPSKPNSIISRKSKAYQLLITDTDVLFQYIFPFFNKMTFLSRKGIDFKIWSLGLFLIIHGYHYTPQGKVMLLKLSNNINSKRYFSNVIDFLNFEEIQALFEIKPVFDIHSGKSHFSLAKKFALQKGSKKGYKVYIYKNGKEIPGSPFYSYREGAKAVGIISVSSIKNYIDTNKIFKDKYTFYSKPINNSYLN
uniref:LAGLIDADG homing endonuclease n=1 Tax=Fomitiporia mediterranea TaxID=208960 RepID=A0A5B9RAX2_9AGAM|nr:LAGLIDADG homing endonuclease [Fomitiporia mediterranea]QEG57076.1 LAGLIDADG homing endonuclease [Fomitiporia mediterranea]